jgi:hypothetical protein
MRLGTNDGNAAIAAIKSAGNRIQRAARTIIDGLDTPAAAFSR